MEHELIRSGESVTAAGSPSAVADERSYGILIVDDKA
jgi:hypothetical protein